MSTPERPPEPTPVRPDPFLAHRFKIEVDGLVVAGFSEVSGLQVETEFEEIQEGGQNRYRHKLAKSSKYGNLTLKRGITDSTVLWDWHRSVVEGTVQRKTVHVIVWDVFDPQTRRERWRWSFAKAYPVKWNGPDLKSDASSVAIETLELAHNGITSAQVTQAT